MSEALAQRFWAKTRRMDSGCIEWVGGRNRNGYGTFSVWGSAAFSCRMQLAHRVAWFLHTGEVANGLVLHSCDNPPCVNPDHLRLGTQFDNMRDCVERRRHGGGARPGAANHSAKLKESQVRQIRALKGVERYRDIAKRFGVHEETVGEIMRGKRWTSAK